ncbi:hypothetical protein FDECE_9746 [Fusarium decemcellulare]|nr:hypothetical protein FDECE_9746 [Fusarium decemcellulare]
MQRYCSDRPIHDQGDMILLRQDLQHVFDQGRFAFVARRTQEGPPRVAVQVLVPLVGSELAELYHSRQLQHLRGLSKEFLFARFAWSIFQYTYLNSRTGMTKRAVSLFDASTGESRVHQLSAREIRERSTVFSSPTLSRSNRGHKRRRWTDEDFNEDDLRRGHSPSDGNSWNESYDEPSRGRRRKRNW